MAEPDDIRELLTGGCLQPLFQPIVSPLDNHILGFEGLIRGRQPGTAAIIPPDRLFAQTADEDFIIALDAACRATILREYGRLYRHNREISLFINIHQATILRGGNILTLFKEVHRWGLHPENIAIELDESAISDTRILERFIEEQRRHGFCIAFDDFGNGSFSLPRIAIFRPDYVKIDISIIRNIHRNADAREKFVSFSRSAAENGGIIIAEGVETEDEAREIARLGGDLIQGFYFLHPMELHTIDQQERRRIHKICRRLGKTKLVSSLNNLITTTDRRRLDILICPACGRLLEVSAEHEWNDYIRTGTLNCAHCQEVFPIVSGIPIMRVPDRSYPGR